MGVSADLNHLATLAAFHSSFTNYNFAKTLEGHVPNGGSSLTWRAHFGCPIFESYLKYLKALGCNALRLVSHKILSSHLSKFYHIAQLLT